MDNFLGSRAILSGPAGGVVGDTVSQLHTHMINMCEYDIIWLMCILVHISITITISQDTP